MGCAGPFRLPFLARRPAGDHDVGVGGIGAGGDGGDDDGAVVQILVYIHAVTGFDAGDGGLNGDGAGPLGEGGYGDDAVIGEVLWCARGGGRGGAGDVAGSGGVAAFTFPADHLAGGARVGADTEEVGQLLGEAGGGLGEEHPILRALGAGDAWLYGAEVKREGGAVLGFRSVRGVEEALGAHVGLDEGDLGVCAAGEAKVGEGFCVDREDAAGGTVLWGHVGDGGAVCKGECLDAGAVELDELADDALLAEGLGYGEDEVGGGGALFERAGEAEADDLRDQHRDGLAEHGSLSLNAADAPAEDAKAIDHGGVRVRADEGVWVGKDQAVRAGRSGEDDAGEVFQVDLVADAHAGGDGGKVVEGGLAPFEEGVALAIALELERGVKVIGVGGAELVNLDGVVDDELRGLEGVDFFGVAAKGAHGIAHGGKIDDGGDAGEVLHEDAGGHVGDLAGRLGLWLPGGEEADVIRGDGAAVLMAKEVFKQDPEREGEAGEIVTGEGGERKSRTLFPCRW